LADEFDVCDRPVPLFDAVLMLVRLPRLAPGAIEDGVAGGETAVRIVGILREPNDSLHRLWRGFLR
jgi:hypothetical protein